MSLFVFDSLESRKLLSGNGLTPTGAQIIAADTTEYHAALSQQTADTAAAQTQTAADAEAVKVATAETINGSAQKAKLKADTAAAPVILQNDQTAIQTAATNGLPAITSDFEQIASDSGNSTALKTDNKKLARDQAAYQSAVSAAVAQYQADQISTQNAIAADNAAITALLNSTEAYVEAIAIQTVHSATESKTALVDQAIVDGAYVQLQTDIINYGPLGSTTISGSTNDDFQLLWLPISDAATQADQSEINAIQAQLTADQNTQTTQLVTDNEAVKVATMNAVNGSKQKAQLKADEAAAPLTEAADEKLIRQAAHKNLPAVITAYEQIAADQGQSSQIIAKDQSQLITAQATLHNAVAAAVTHLQADETASQKAIAADQAALNALRDSSTAYQSATAELNSDTSTDVNKVQTDQAILSAAQAKLSVDQAGAPLSGENVYTGSTTLIESGGLLTVGQFASGGLLTVGQFANFNSGSVSFIIVHTGQVLPPGEVTVLNVSGGTAGTLMINGSGTLALGSGMTISGGTLTLSNGAVETVTLSANG